MDDDAEISKSPKAVIYLPDLLHESCVSVAQRRRYESLRSKFAGLPVRISKGEEGRLADVLL